MDLQDVAGRAILRDVIGGPDKSEWRVLVLDALTTGIVQACLQMHQLTKEKILTVESVEVERSPQPGKEAIYFLAPTESSVRALIKDFKAEAMYAGAHVFFSQPIPDRLFQAMAQSRLVAGLRNLREVNIAFTSLEGQAYTLEMEGSLEGYYGAAEGKRRGVMEGMAERLASLCSSLGDYPVIR